MSAEGQPKSKKPEKSKAGIAEGTPIGLTPDQATRVADQITNRWDNEKGLRLDGGVLEDLIRKFGSDAKISNVLEALKKEPKQ